MMAMINAIKAWTFNFTNFLIGHTVFFVVIFGWFLVITGLIFLSQPEKARTKLVRQGFGTARMVLQIVLLYAAVLALSVFGKVSSPWGGLLSLGSIVALVWLYFSLTKKSLKVITDKLALLPVSSLRGYALGQIVVGAMMITLHKRIW